MPIGLNYGLLAALAWGSTDVLATIGGRRLGSLRVAAIAELTSLAIVIGLAIVRGEGLPRDPAVIVACAVFGVVAAGAYLSFFTALRIGPIAVVSPVVAAYGGLTVVLSVALRGESLTPLQAVGAAIATFGVILAGVVSDGGWRGTRIVGSGVLLSLLAMVLFAALTVGLAGPIRVAGWLPVLLVSRLATAVSIWLFLAVVAGRSRVPALMGKSGSLDGRALAAPGWRESSTRPGSSSLPSVSRSPRPGSWGWPARSDRRSRSWWQWPCGASACGRASGWAWPGSGWGWRWWRCPDGSAGD